MSDMKKLRSDFDKARKAEEELLEERRSKRETLSKSEFRAYNEETRDKQLEVVQARRDAEAAITEHLNNVRQDVFVGTISESEAING